MPIIKSAKKRMRQNERRRAANRMRRSTLRTAGDREAVKARWGETQGLIDRTARLGVIHPNAAARTKSRLARQIQKLA